MSYLGVGVSPGNVPVFHGSNLRVLDKRVRLAELILRCLICALAVVSAVLIGTDTQVKEFFTIKKRAKFTDMKALVFLVVADGIAAAYSFFQLVRCGVSMVRRSVLFNKPLAWAIFSGDQIKLEHYWLDWSKFVGKQSENARDFWILAYLSMAAVAASVQSAVFSKYGQTELEWMKTCTLFGKFCNQIGEGVATSVAMTLSTLILSAISAFSLFRLYGDNGKETGRW
ncbi:hypothetical protein SASPL_156850 [Salvia splendens]|uniref:CASP-like protein n=1 Tax=Salvia splendens TaxID=180675 RepID=A0A8X8VVY7_SALSN|nr:hypothetical protein SASPL_156850 [Salvia splendens]